MVTEIDLGNIKSTTPLGSPILGGVLLKRTEEEEGTISVIQCPRAVKGDTTMAPEGARTGKVSKANSTDAVALAEQAEDDPTQFHRVLFSLRNMLEVSKTLQPGYQVTTTIDAYYHDVHHPLPKHKVLDKTSEEEVLARMKTQLDKIAAMAKVLWWNEKITLKSVRDPGEQLRLILSIEPSSSAKISNVPTCMMVARAQREAKAGVDQSKLDRVTLCIANAIDLASTLLPGYQVNAALSKDSNGRFRFTVTESKHADYHSDVKKPAPGESSIKGLPRDEQLVNLKAKLDQILSMSRGLNDREPLTFTIACDSHRNLHLRANLGDTKKLLSKDALDKMVKDHVPRCSRNRGGEGAKE